MNPLLTALLTLGLPAFQPQNPIFAELRDSAYWFETLVLPEEQITLSTLEALSLRLLKRAGSHRRLVTLDVFTTAHIAAQETGVNCDNYKQWAVYYDRFPRDRLAVASMIAIGDDIVLRVRRSDGAIVRRILKGKDPTRFWVDGYSFEVLVVGGRTVSGFEKCAIPGTVQPLLYIQTGAPRDTSLYERATAFIANSVGSKYVFVRYRNDHWFICEQGFPVVYPFSLSSASPPSEGEHYDSVSFACNVSCDGKPSCKQTSGAPFVPGRAHQ